MQGAYVGEAQREEDVLNPSLYVTCLFLLPTFPEVWLSPSRAYFQVWSMAVGEWADEKAEMTENSVKKHLQGRIYGVGKFFTHPPHSPTYTDFRFPPSPLLHCMKKLCDGKSHIFFAFVLCIKKEISLTLFLHY